MSQFTYHYTIVLISCTRAFEHILLIDRKTYGDSSSYTLPDGTTDVFQNSVDDVITR
jgi:hypothetical protein